jgi:nucleoid-associated protein YgaU
MTDETTVTEPTDRSTDPTRFGPSRRDGESEQRPVGEIVGSAAALLLLLVGLPVALLLLAGPPPIPTSLPSARDFAQQLSFEDLLTVLVAVLWLTWLWFVVCVVVEVLAALRGGLARSVPLAGPLQRLARVLVGALLLTGIMAGQAQAVEAPSTAPTTSVSALVTADLPPVATADDTTADAVADEQADHVGEKVYTVKAPKDGYHDNLWDIAERHLGEGRRYHEIYELNKDKVQADGGKLQLARLIQPGWELVMPDDAVGIERVAAPAPAPVEAPPAAPSSDPAGDVSADSADGAVASEQSDRSAWMGGIGLLAAGVIGALALQRRRAAGRRPGDDARELEAGLRVAASSDRVDRFDHVLRELTAQCRRAGVNPPPAYAALVDDTSVELLLAPARTEAVEGWEVLEDGRRWRSTATLDGPRPTEAVPYPAMVALGVDPDGRDVLIDLESAGGIVAVTGDPGVAEQVAAAVAVQAATAPWSEVVQVTASDLPDGIAEVGDERLRVADLAAELDGFERQISSLRDSVLIGRMGRRGATTSHVVVSGRVPSDDVSARLGALMGSGRQAFSVLVAGEHPGARWRLQVDDQGTLTLPLLGLTVDANRVTAAQVGAVAELFSASREADRPDDGDRVAIPVPGRDHDDADWTSASHRVAVLGRVAVQGGGALADERLEQATELVVHLAMHPEGVHPTVLAGAVWPRGVTADVRDAAIRRAREWLGSDADGSHLLREDAEGRLSLAPSVVCDWDCARTLLLRSRRAGTPRAEVDLLRRGLKMARGEAFVDVPQGRYAWIVRDDLPRTIARVLVDASVRLAQLLSDQDDPAGASTAAEAGLRVSPAHQELWRALLRSRHAESGVAGVRRTLDEMGAALDSVPLEAETEALVNELMPDTGSMATSG